MCQKCLIEEHQNHVQFSLNIKDIETQIDPLKITNWPNHNREKLINFLKELEQNNNFFKISDVETLFSDFENSIMQKIKTIK